MVSTVRPYVCKYWLLIKCIQESEWEIHKELVKKIAWNRAQNMWIDIRRTQMAPRVNRENRIEKWLFCEQGSVAHISNKSRIVAEYSEGLQTLRNKTVKTDGKTWGKCRQRSFIWRNDNMSFTHEVIYKYCRKNTVKGTEKTMS